MRRAIAAAIAVGVLLLPTAAIAAERRARSVSVCTLTNATWQVTISALKSGNEKQSARAFGLLGTEYGELGFGREDKFLHAVAAVMRDDAEGVLNHAQETHMFSLIKHELPLLKRIYVAQCQ